MIVEIIWIWWEWCQCGDLLDAGGNWSPWGPNYKCAMFIVHCFTFPLASCSLQIKQHAPSFLLSSLCNLPSCSLIFAHCVSSFLKLFALCLLALLAAWCCDLASGERPPMQMAGCQRLVNVKEGEGRSKIVEWYLLRFASNYIHVKIMPGRWYWQSKKGGRTIHKTMGIIAKNGSFLIITGRGKRMS